MWALYRCLQAFESTAGDLAERMLAALDAAEAEGGDLRGRQSASMLVVISRFQQQLPIGKENSIRRFSTDSSSTRTSN